MGIGQNFKNKLQKRDNVMDLTVDIKIPYTDKIPLWIIIVSALGALLVLLCIWIICWRCGVFKNPDAEDDDANVETHEATLMISSDPKAETIHYSQTRN